ncbi:MAG: ribosomal RNA small subunit methyltransferase I, partial [Candidatus Diapherotrites archaeon]|nr:ribosomal RNA small subunit methyltransferase I [Candidatus Diapherotrites archaeon]
RVVAMLAEGKRVCYVSDAGTPGVSDPGGKLVAAATRAGYGVVPIPGPSAMTAALSVAGFPTEPMTFVGFPPHKKGRKTFFAETAGRSDAVVLYESTHRIMKTLAELPQDRVAFVGRELTKLHETHYRGTVREIIAQLEQTSTKGEFVIVLAPTFWK